MIAFESSEFSKWLPMILIPVLIIIILGLSYWYFARRQRNKKKINRTISRTKPSNYLSSPSHGLPKKPLSTSSSQLTSTDRAYLDKLVRTASDRSLWTRDNSKKAEHKKLRKVPSGQMREKS